MCVHARVLALVAVLGLLAAGCSRPVSPVPRGAGGAGAARGDPAAAPIPDPYIVRLKFVGPVVTLDASGGPVLERNAEFFIYSTGELPTDLTPLDTVPAHSELKQVLWRTTRSGATGASTSNDPGVTEGASVLEGTAAPASAQEFTPGFHVLELNAPERAGGGKVTVAFVVGWKPGAWWAGPDPDLFPRASDGDGRAVDVTDWSRFTTVPAWPPDGRGYFGPDSFLYVPPRRRPVRGDLERRTFYEIFGDRIYARAEGDTVHLGSWVVLANGGYDRDSRYEPRVVPTDPGLPAGYASSPDRYPVLIPQGLLGSPVAFRIRVSVRLPDGRVAQPSETTPYPWFDPASVFRSPRVAGYWAMSLPGKAYAVIAAEDAEGMVGRVPGDPVTLADRVDAGGGTPADRLARRQVLTFFVRDAAGAGTAQAVPATRRRSARGS